MRRLTHLTRALASACLVAGLAAAPAGASDRMTEYSGFYSPAPLTDLAVGNDGNLWAPMPGYGLSRFTTGGSNEYASLAGLSPTASATHVASGADGNLWFTEASTSRERIGRVTPVTSGGPSAFTGLTTFTSGFVPGRAVREPALGPDGAIWFAYDTSVGRIATDGAVTTFPLPSGHTIDRITRGPDGAMWFTQGSRPWAGRIAMDGAVTTVPLPAFAPMDRATGITTGSDGNVWIATKATLLRLTPAGGVTVLGQGLRPGTAIHDLTTGPDGHLYFTDDALGTIGRATVDGAVSQYDTNGTPGSLAAGPDNAVWFTGTTPDLATSDPADTTNVLGRFPTTAAPTATVRPEPPTTASTATITVDLNAEGLPTTAHLEWGLTPDYGNATPNVALDGVAPFEHRVTLAGLQAGVVFHYRVVATNEKGSTVTGNFTFRTPSAARPPAPAPPAPTATSEPAGATSAPVATVEALSPTASRVRMASTGIVRLPLACTSAAACAGTVTVTAKVKRKAGTTIARKAVSVKAGGATKLGLRLSAAGKRAVRSAGRKGLPALVTVTIGDAKKRYRVTLRR